MITAQKQHQRGARQVNMSSFAQFYFNGAKGGTACLVAIIFDTNKYNSFFFSANTNQTSKTFNPAS